LYEEQCNAVYKRTDHLFGILLILQWLAALVTAVTVSPFSWEGTISSVHIHVWTALVLGSLISSLPLYLVLAKPGKPVTRHAVAIAQTLYSALFIHLSGGRIETHFHVFGSLALLAIYRDWRVLMTASIVVCADHIVRGELWPQSVYGLASVDHWRWVEHAAYVLFEDIFLMKACIDNNKEMHEIAERQAELEQMNEVRAQEQRFRTLCDLSPLGIFQADEAGQITFTNDRFEQIVGDAPLPTWKGEARLVDPATGSIRWINVLSNGVRDMHDRVTMYVGTVEDITERKNQQSRTDALAQIVELTNDAVCSYDLEGNVLSWNEAASRLFQYEREEVLGNSFSSLPVDHDFPSLLQHIVQNDLVVNQEATRTRKDGEAIDVSVTASALRSTDGKLTGISVIARDITNKKEAEKRIGEFYSTISHELRTPLTSIRGALSLIDDGIVAHDSADAVELIKIAKASSIRLIRLINEILDLRKIEAGKLALHLAPAKASVLVTNVANSMIGMAAEVGVTIDTDLVDDIDVYVDNDRITQVLTNLMSNAIKFSPEGGQVNVRLEVTGQRVRFSVIDQGPGIPEAEQHKLFGRFQQLDSSDSRPKDGTGLGLAICKALVEEHRGNVGVNSRPGHGSVFYFELPISSTHKASATGGPASTQVLVVEDDFELATLIKEQLRHEDISCHLVSNKLDCLEYLQKNTPEVILLDLLLPDGNGLEIVDFLRNHADLHNVPVVVMSGDTTQKDFALPLVFEFVPKPFDQPMLVAALSRALGSIQSKRALLIDDDPDTRAVLAAQLKSLSIESMQAGDGEEAIAILQNEVPDLIVLDVTMPKIDGFEVVDWLRKNQNSIPLLIYTGCDLDEEQRAELSLDLTKQLVKGAATEAEFVAAVKSLLGKFVEPHRGVKAA
jgi:PAS domain S-box-containing protein